MDADGQNHLLVGPGTMDITTEATGYTLLRAVAAGAVTVDVCAAPRQSAPETGSP